MGIENCRQLQSMAESLIQFIQLFGSFFFRTLWCCVDLEIAVFKLAKFNFLNSFVNLIFFLVHRHQLDFVNRFPKNIQYRNL